MINGITFDYRQSVAFKNLSYSYLTQQLFSLKQRVVSISSILVNDAMVSWNQQVPQSIKKAIQVTNQWVKYTGKFVVIGLKSFDEVILPNFGAIRTTESSIQHSFNRLDKHNPRLAESSQWLSSKLAGIYLENAQKIQQNFSVYLLHKCPQKVQKLIKRVFDSHQELISQTLEANALYLIANLADQSYPVEFPFADGAKNPFGRLLAILISCFDNLEEEMGKLEQMMDGADKEEDIQRLFKKVSHQFLSKIWPKGPDDLQVFHPLLPTGSVKLLLWEMINEKLPGLIKTLYLNTRAFGKAHPQWKESFLKKTGGFQVEPLMKIPTLILAQVKNDDRYFEALEPLLKKGLKSAGCLYSNLLSATLIGSLKEFLRTKEPCLISTALFLERYLMELILYSIGNFSEEYGMNSFFEGLTSIWLRDDKLAKIFEMTLKGSAPCFQMKNEAMNILLKPLGLNEYETFPCPEPLKKGAWPLIQTAISKKLPAILFESVPTINFLKERDWTIKKLENVFEDSFFSIYLPMLTETITKNLFDQLDIRSCTAQAGSLCGLSIDQQLLLGRQAELALHRLFDDLTIKQEAGGQASLFNIFQRFMDSLAFKLCDDLFQNYKNTCVNKKKGASLPFVEWLIKSLNHACGHLSIEKMGLAEKEAMKEAIYLKNSLSTEEDREKHFKMAERFKELWPSLYPKFLAFSKDLIGILGDAHLKAFPLPSKAKTFINKTIEEHLPKILFEETGDLLLPLLEKDQLQKCIREFSYGELIVKGCNLMARDIEALLPVWAEEIVEHIPESFEVISTHWIHLTGKAEKNLKVSLKFILSHNTPYCEAARRFIKESAESHFLKIALKACHLKDRERTSVRALLKKTFKSLDAERCQESIVNFHYRSSVKAIGADFANQFFALFGLNANDRLYGIPPVLQNTLQMQMKDRFAQGILAVYQMNHQIRRHKISHHPIEKELPLDLVKKASQSFVLYFFDYMTDYFPLIENGEMNGVAHLYVPIKKWMSAKHQRGFQISKMVLDLIEKNLFTSQLEDFFRLLNESVCEPIKNEIAECMQSVVADKILKELVPVIQYEEKKKSDFYHALALSILPLLKNHLQQLNQASQLPGGINEENFFKINSQNRLDPSLSYSKKYFKEKQTQFLFDTLFPKGIAQFTEILSPFEFKQEQIDFFWKSSKEAAAFLLPNAIECMFNKEVIGEFFVILLELILKNLTKAPFPSSQNEEASEDPQLDLFLSEFLEEIILFLDLPNFKKIPLFIKKILGINTFEKKGLSSLRQMIQKKINPKLFVRTFQEALTQFTEKRYTKRADYEVFDIRLKKLERSLVIEGIAYFARLIKKEMISVTNIFKDYSKLNQIRLSVIAALSYVLEKLTRFFSSLFKIDQLLVNKAEEMIQKRVAKNLEVFSQKNLHLNFAYLTTEAFIKAQQSLL